MFSTSPLRWRDCYPIAFRADSILVQLSDREFRAGLAALRAYAKTAPHAPVTEPVDFFVFRPV